MRRSLTAHACPEPPCTIVAVPAAAHPTTCTQTTPVAAVLSPHCCPCMRVGAAIAPRRPAPVAALLLPFIPDPQLAVRDALTGSVSGDASRASLRFSAVKPVAVAALAAEGVLRRDPWCSATSSTRRRGRTSRRR